MLAVALFCLGAGFSPATSSAAVPPQFALTDQYRETIPGVTGGENVNDAKGGKPQRSDKLESLEKRGEDGAELSELVTLTAPSAALSEGKNGIRPNAANNAKDATESDSAIVAIADQAFEPAVGGSIGMLLPIGLVLLAGAAIGYSVIRFRSNDGQVS